MARGPIKLQSQLFIDDLPDYINCSENLPMLGNMSLGYLMYADDTILLAKCENDLQKAVEGVEKVVMTGAWK